MNTNMKTILRIARLGALVAALFAAIGTLTGCGTVHGVGQDVESIGRGLQEPFKQDQ
jgi:predicted small secreted protein